MPDHCRPYALSHASENALAKKCDHQHDLVCERCNLFRSTVKEIKEVLEQVEMSQDKKNELRFQVEQAKKSIDAWKSHLLRSINQDEARVDILNSLDNTSVLVVLDWAMKFIPRKYRESQTDWFGKRGISWHVSVVTRKVDDKPQMLTLVHTFQKSNQDSFYVLAVIDDVIHQLKKVMPELKSVNFRQDNAGCYHSATTVLGVRQLAQKHDVSLKMDFSDPQGGKGPCDRKAATIKNHMRSYLNSGNDISNASQMKRAIESNGGVRGVTAILCGPLNIPNSDLFEKWEGISFINNVEFKEDHMKVWRAYGTGEGKEVPYSEFGANASSHVPELLPSFSSIEDTPDDPIPSFNDVTPRHIVKEKAQRATTSETPDGDSDTDEDTLFTCSVEGCVKTFQRFSSLQTHLDIGKHKYALERETLLDKAKIKYAQKLESGQSAIDTEIDESDLPSSSDVTMPLPMGWALKSSASRRRLSKNQKSYLTDLFLLGEQTRRKADPDEVAKSMRKAQHADGTLRFQNDEYLTSKQISSFFSRLASKKSVPDTNTSDDDGEEDEQLSAMKESEFHQMRLDILNEISINHPILYDAYNICELASRNKLTKFSISMLKQICAQFDLDTSGVKQTRKKPYIDILTNLVKSCSCQSDQAD